MPKVPPNWPPGALPRMMDVRQISYYVGVSPVTFLERVKRGRYPHGMKEGARVLWDRKGLDAILDLRSGLSDQYAEELEATAEEAKALAALLRDEAPPRAKPYVPPTPEEMDAYVASYKAYRERLDAFDNDPEAIGRVLAAHEAGETSREIGEREGLTGQKIAAIVRRAKRQPRQ